MSEATAPETTKKPLPPLPVKTFIDRPQLEADLSWSSADITAGLMNQAPRFIHYGRLMSEASAQVDKFKATLETAEATVYRNLRDEAVSKGQKVTEAQLEKDVAAHPSIQLIKRAVNESKQVEAMLKVIVEGFRQRKDLLVSAGLIAREEMRGETVIRGREDDLRGMQRRVMASIEAPAS